MASYGEYGNASYGSQGNGQPGTGGGAPGMSYDYGATASTASPSPSSSYAAPSYAASPMAQASGGSSDGGLRRRQANSINYGNNGYGDYNNDDSNGKHKGPSRAMVEKLDIMFPKVDREFIVQTKNGGIMTMVAYGLIALLCLTECITWISQNRAEVSKTFVDTSLGKQMRVNLNITFPGLACEDLHVDIIDIAGDSQLDIEDTLKKKKLHRNGRVFSRGEIDVETNQHRTQQEEKQRILKQELPPDYCGPCYGAQERDDQCCQTCDEVMIAYTKMKWKADLLKYTAEQCIREGRDHMEPKKMTSNQGCNLSGYMTVNRVNGNFHIAMGEGVERDGRHIHTYLPEDAPNFNASHIIHQLSFGPEDGTEPLNGATKIVTEKSGTTGLFQYFIKVVPTTYVGEDAFPGIVEGADSLPSLYPEAEDAKKKEKTVETNRYFFTERFMPLMTELLDDNQREGELFNKAAVQAGQQGDHSNPEHHMKQNAVLPGVFFIYEIYPFAVEIRRNHVPFTHLLIRLMATIGGVLTLVKSLDSFLYDMGAQKKSSPFSR